MLIQCDSVQVIRLSSILQMGIDAFGLGLPNVNGSEPLNFLLNTGSNAHCNDIIKLISMVSVIHGSLSMAKEGRLETMENRGNLPLVQPH